MNTTTRTFKTFMLALELTLIVMCLGASVALVLAGAWFVAPFPTAIALFGIKTNITPFGKSKAKA